MNLERPVFNSKKQNRNNTGKKSPFPGEFEKTDDGKKCARKIQVEMSKKQFAMLEKRETRIDWFKNQIENGWFENKELGMFSE